MITKKEFNILQKKYNLVMNVVLNNKHLREGTQKDDLLETWDKFDCYLYSLTLEHSNNKKLESINKHVTDINVKMGYSWDRRAFIDLSEEIEKLR